MRRVTTLVSALLAGALVLTACGGGDDDADTTPEAVGQQQRPRQRRQGRSGLRHRRPRRPVVQRRRRRRPGQGRGRARRRDQGGRGQQRRDRDRQGGAAARARQRRATTRSSRSASPTPARSAKVAKELPGHPVRDHRRRVLPLGDNIANLVFAEEQGSFLVGAAAALKSKTGNIGFVGGVEVPLIKKFEAGYKAGAKAVNPDIKVQVKYLTQPPDFSGFDDPAKGKTAAAGHVRRRRRHRLPGRRRLRWRRVRGRAGAGGNGHRRRLRPVQHRRPGGQGRHHHLDAQEGRRGGLRLHQVGRRRRVHRRPDDRTTSRRTASATRPPVARSTTSRPSWTSTRQQIIAGEITVPTE